MSEPFVFRPPWRRGLLFHSIVVLALAAASAFSAYYAFTGQIGGYFVLLLLIAVLLAAPLPLLIYRAYALVRAGYWLERDGLRLRWGLRAEDIPLTEIEWVHNANDLVADPPLPRLSLPGAVIGNVNAADLGHIEYLASTSKPLILIATARKVYAISPEDTDGFLRTFQRTLEMGSLAPLESVSVLPAAYVSQVWADRAARILLLSGLIISLLLFTGASLAVPTRSAVALGFYPDGTRLPWVSSSQILLLPILAGFFFLVDLLAGLFFYRWEDRRSIAYLLWSGGLGAALLLSLGTLFILF